MLDSNFALDVAADGGVGVAADVEVGAGVNVESDVAAYVVTGGAVCAAAPDGGAAADTAYDVVLDVDVVTVYGGVVRGNGSAGKACLSRQMLLYIHYPPL